MCECLSCHGRESIYFGQSFGIVHKSFTCNFLLLFLFSLCPVRGVLDGWCLFVVVKLTLWEINISCDWHFIGERSFESLSNARACVHTKSFGEFTYPLKHDLLHSECVFSSCSRLLLLLPSHSLFLARDTSANWCLSSSHVGILDTSLHLLNFDLHIKYAFFFSEIAFLFFFTPSVRFWFIWNMRAERHLSSVRIFSPNADSEYTIHHFYQTLAALTHSRARTFFDSIRFYPHFVFTCTCT